MIQRDCLPVTKDKYWYELSFQPIMSSLNVRFDLSGGTTEQAPLDLPYVYDSIETDCVLSESDFKVFTIVSADTLAYEDNGINYIPCTSQESQIFAKVLIGTSVRKHDQIFKITRENYLEYLDCMIGKSFIDFSVANQINKDAYRDECEQVDISYFYQVGSSDD